MSLLGRHGMRIVRTCWCSWDWIRKVCRWSWITSVDLYWCFQYSSKFEVLRLSDKVKFCMMWSCIRYWEVKKSCSAQAIKVLKSAVALCQDTFSPDTLSLSFPMIHRSLNGFCIQCMSYWNYLYIFIHTICMTLFRGKFIFSTNSQILSWTMLLTAILLPENSSNSSKEDFLNIKVSTIVSNISVMFPHEQVTL